MTLPTWNLKQFYESIEDNQINKDFKSLLINSGNFQKKYRGKLPLFIEEGIDQKLNQIFDSEIKLSSGGYLVINPTEALVSIDINSGTTETISIKPFMLKTYDNLLFEQNSLKHKSIKKNEIIIKSKLAKILL